MITCPVGITAVADDGEVIGELNDETEQLVVARGGKGGSSANRWTGQSGQQMSLNLDLKLIADVGMIGFPNAGKSTLLSLVSRARPKIANYPCKIFEYWARLSTEIIFYFLFLFSYYTSASNRNY